MIRSQEPEIDERVHTSGGGAVVSAQLARAERSAPEQSIAKRVLDIVMALTIATVMFPVMVLIALLIRIDSPGPVFFRSTRVGHRGQRLQMLKFRKMQDLATGAQLTTHGDERFTRVGKWLARFKLDELPQLWHVLTGEMSLVGPRPESHDFVAHYAQAYEHITRVRPGLVGLSQLAFAGESAILDPDDPLDHYLRAILPQKVRLDRFYADQWSLWLDLRILLWTLVAVLLHRQVAVNRSTGRLGLRRR